MNIFTFMIKPIYEYTGPQQIQKKWGEGGGHSLYGLNFYIANHVYVAVQ